MVQESTGFSPAELVFCHTPRGLLAILKDAWLSESNPRSVLQHVGDIRSHIFTVREMAKKTPPGSANEGVLTPETPLTKAVMLSSLVDTEEDDITDPSRSVPVGRLTNSEMLAKLPESLSYLAPGESRDIQRLIREFGNLFGDVPSQTNVLEHDIDVGSSLPIKQHPYRVNPTKRAHLQREVEYMLSHNIAEPSASAWSSPCLLVGKSDSSLRFCTDYRRVNSVTKPDCFPLPRTDDCVDRVGATVYVSKFNMLKGYWQVPLTARARNA